MVKSNRHIERFVSVFAWLVALLLLLLISFRFLISTEIAHGFINQKIENELNKELNAEVTIGDISGDAWENLVFENIEIQTGSFNVSVEKAEIKYVLVNLLFGEPKIEFIQIQDISAIIALDSLLSNQSHLDENRSESAATGLRINEIQIIEGDFEINSQNYLPDSSLLVRDFVFQGNLQIGEEKRLGIQDLNFIVDHGRLPEAISFGLDGAVSDNSITLNDLVFGVGESVIKGAIEADLATENLTGQVSSNKVEISDFISKLSPNRFSELEMELDLRGSLDDFTVTISADGPDVQNLSFESNIYWNQKPVIRSINLHSDYLNVAELFESDIVIDGPLSIDAKGNFSGFDSSTDLEWNIGISNFEVDEIHFEELISNGELNRNALVGQLNLLSAGGEVVTTEFKIDSLFSTNPYWEIDYFIQNLNPNLIDERFVDGVIHASGEVSGSSFSLPDSMIDFTVRNLDPNSGEQLKWEINDDKIDEVNFKAQVSSEQLISEGFLRIIDSELEIEVQAFKPFDAQSEYTYQANLLNFNIGYLSMFKGNSTKLTGGLYGIGKGRTPEEANIFGTLSLQNGQINNATIDSFDATVQYEYGMFTIREGELKSEIADGAVTGRRDIMDLTNPDNELNLDLNLKNLQPLAGIFGLIALEAKGQLDGTIQQDENGVLNGDFNLNLSNVLVDSVFTASSILGTSNVQIESKRVFDASLEIVNPLINDIVFQDIKMETIGSFTEDSLMADFDLTVIGSERGRLVQEGNIRKDITNQLSDIQFSRFDFLTTESDLLLQQPFNVRVYKSDFGTDTLKLLSDDGAFLEFAIPFSSESEAQAFVIGESFDLGLIQEIVFGNRFIDGILSGELNYHQTPGDVLGNGLARIDELVYKGSEADSLIFSFDIVNERLDAKGNVYWENTLAATGWANVPFVINKEELDDEFYNRAIQGNLEIKPTNLDRFKDLLKDIGIENTTGIASLNGVMSGEAGTPKFNGIIEVDEPVLSGIPVDRLSAEFNYINQLNSLIIQSEIFAKNTPVAEFNIVYPLEYDFRTFELFLPEEDEELEIKAVTNDLNIAIFNDFVNPNYIANLVGFLNVDLQFSGPLGDIQPYGFLNIRGGSLSVPYSGIQLKNITMQLDVDSTMLDISRFYAESGRGRMYSSGTASLNGIIPQDISMIVDASRFELANTRDMNLVVDLNSDLTGNIINPLLSGKATVHRGFYMLTNFGDEAIEEVILEDEEIDTFSPYDSMSIDIDIDFRRDFYVRSRDYLDMEVEPKGSINVLKQKNTEPEIYGVLNVDEGYIRPLGKRFNLNQGTFTFIGDSENPEIDISSSYTPQTRQKGESVLLYYNINGTRLEPEFSFESDPFMEQQDVICYTLFNKPCYSLDSWQSIFAEGNDVQAFQALSDVLLDEVEALATRELGVDVVQIDNSGQNGRTAITTGWYLNERTFFSIINELTSSTPKTLFVLEYILNESWDLIITQGEDSRQGVDVRYQFDY